MKLYFKISLAAMLLMTVMTSCKKDKEQPTRRELLSKAPWIQTASSAVRQSDGATFDVFSGLAACKQDDAYTFAADNTFLQMEGDTKCNTADPQLILTGTWTFAADETAIIVSAPGAGTSTFTILELTGSTLKMQVTQGGYVGTGTYRH